MYDLDVRVNRHGALDIFSIGQDLGPAAQMTESGRERLAMLERDLLAKLSPPEQVAMPICEREVPSQWPDGPAAGTPPGTQSAGQLQD